MKKRKLNGSATDSTRLLKLSQTYDIDELAEKRKKLFEDFWLEQKPKFKVNSVKREQLRGLLAFAKDGSKQDCEGRIPTALLLTGLDEGNGKAVLRAFSESSQQKERVVIELHARQCTNLQAALKNITKEAILETSGLDAYSTFLNKHKRLIPLSFDLELLELFVRENRLSQIVVALSDVETFDSHVINELISTLHLWHQRIHFVLMLGISSTRELFERKFSKSCLKMMYAQSFEFVPSSHLTSSIVRQIQQSDERKSHLYLGPSIMAALSDISQGQGSSARTLENALLFTYMSHFLANPLSVLVSTEVNPSDKDANSCIAQAARKTQSFRQHCDELVSKSTKGSKAMVRELLQDDEALLTRIKASVSEGQIEFTKSLQMVATLADLHQVLVHENSKTQRPKFEVEAELYQALSDLTDCAVFDEVETSIKSLTPSRLIHVLKSIQETASSIIPDLNDLIAILEQPYQGMVNGDDTVGTNGVPTSLSTPTTPKNRGKNGASTKSSQKGSRETSDTASVIEVSLTKLKDMLRQSSLDVSSLLLHEAYIVSARNIRFKQNFEPHTRSALERALLKPGDYLGCECCTRQIQDNNDLEGIEEFNGTGVHAASRGSLPPASVLFTLLQEAPTIINVRDLFDAFQSRLQSLTSNTEVDDDDDTSLKATMTQFYRALAELKMIGLVRASTGTQIKKRAVGKNSKAGHQEIDFVAKTSWAGL